MTDKVFVDTNVLVYAYDRSAADKHEKAKNLIADLWGSGDGLLSPQVLQEFYITVTRKIVKPLPLESARAIVVDLSKWATVTTAGEDILGAIDIQRKYKLSFWDAMVIFSAHKGGASLLFSEDLNNGQLIGGVRIENPFAA